MTDKPTATEPEQTPVPPPREPALLHLVHQWQDRLAEFFGVHPADREATVASMLQSSPGDAPGYWLQLLLAMGIASLGLVLGSTASVIGAMLISPLMGPIVELGMGLAVGAPLLVLRSAVRTFLSVLIVICCSALLTLSLPFQEVTSEILARTSPTALDLLIAIFCAIAAAYTTLKPSSATTGTAAGTAIGIALVPPLCVVGYGIGTRATSIASGAALLFTANFCAILLFTVLAFLCVGYSRASAIESERLELAKEEKGGIRRLARGLRFLFGMKYGPLLRVLMPVLLLAGVYIPLREALAQVTWQVQVRASIQKMLASLPESAVRSSFAVDRRDVSVRIVLLGESEKATSLEKDLTSRIAAAAGVVPSVHVTAVPDASALASMTQRMEAAKVPLFVSPKIPSLDSARADLAEALHDAFPSVAGPLLATRVMFPEGAPIVIEMVHFGPPLGPAGVVLLGDRLTHSLGSEVSIRDIPISPEPFSTKEPDVFLPQALTELSFLRQAPSLFGCVTIPKKPEDSHSVELLVRTLKALPDDESKRISIVDGAQYQVTLSTSPCAKPQAPAEEPDAGMDAGEAHDAGASDASKTP